MRKNIVLLNGSPRADESTSMRLLNRLKSRFDDNCSITVVEAAKSLLHHRQPEDYGSMEQADAIVLVFPLYVYCLPGALMEFLVGYSEYLSRAGKPEGQKIYAVVNCGFPESRINNDAAHVVRRFCEEIHASYRFSVLIGSGGMLQPMKLLPPVNAAWKRVGLAFDQIVCDITGTEKPQDISIEPKVPKKLFFWIAQANFAFLAKRNGVKGKQLYRRPYLFGNTADSNASGGMN